MEIKVYSKEELRFVFSAFAQSMGVTDPNASLGPKQKDFLETMARIHGQGFDSQSLERRFSPKEIATAVTDTHKRKRLIQLSAIACLLNRPVDKTGLEFLHSLSTALGVTDPVLPVVRAVSKNQVIKARVLSFRRMMKTILKEVYQSEGILGPMRFFAGILFGWTVNRNKLWSYKKLGLLPEGTFGREYWKHMTEVGFGFPGEPKGIPDAMAYHDVAHVLSGYDTTPGGEICQGAFQAGSRREDGFVFLQFVTLQFHQGIRLTPAAKAETDLFVPNRVLWAVHRGAECRIDVTSQWNYWEVLKVDLKKVRESYALLPEGVPGLIGSRSSNSAQSGM